MEAWTKTGKTQVGLKEGSIFCKRLKDLSQIPNGAIITHCLFYRQWRRKIHQFCARIAIRVTLRLFSAARKLLAPADE